MITPSTTLAPITYGVEPNEYHKLGGNYQRGNPRKVMSNSELKKFSACPSRWVRGGSELSTDSQEWGDLIDCLVLTPDDFEKRYAICPETYPAKGKKKDDPEEQKAWNWNADYCKQWRSEQEANGFKVVKPSDASEAHLAKSRLLKDPVLGPFLSDAETQVQICVDYRDASTGLVVPIKCLLDIVPNKGPLLGDLKTAASGNPHQWAKAVHTHGYHIQAALYMDAFNCVTGETRNTFVHVVQENFAPYEVARRMLSEEYLELGRATYKTALFRYCQCLAGNEWPGLDEADGMGDMIQGWRLVEPEAWMILH